MFVTRVDGLPMALIVGLVSHLPIQQVTDTVDKEGKGDAVAVPPKVVAQVCGILFGMRLYCNRFV